MRYRHILEFENNAELSAVYTSAGKVVVRVRSTSKDDPKFDVVKNYLYPIFCSREDENFQVSAGGVSKAVHQKLWEIIDRINREGFCELPDQDEQSVLKICNRINSVLESLRLQYRVIVKGNIMKIKFIDHQTDI